MILLDTNVLVYTLNGTAAQHLSSRAVVQAAIDGQLPAILVPQVLLELFAVVTNPRRVLRPLDAAAAWDQVQILRANVPVLDLRADALDVLGELVRDRRPRGAAVYDLFLAAQMRTHGVETICTYNTADFVRVPGIEALTPDEVLARYRLR